MNIQLLISINYNAYYKSINLGNQLNHLTNEEILEIIRYIGDNYPSLQELYLAFCNITSLDDSLSKLINLRLLYLWGNQITSLDDSLSNLVNLQILDLRNNQITSLDNSLNKLVNLQDLYLINNKIPLVQIYDYVISTENLTQCLY